MITEPFKFPKVENRKWLSNILKKISKKKKRLKFPKTKKQNYRKQLSNILITKFKKQTENAY